jgi:lipopolysaccharide transport system permease protein
MSSEDKYNNDWDIIVKPRSSVFNFNLKEIWEYKDLVMILVKRDLTSIYKQTVLGPVWMFLHPLFTTAIYTFTFSKSAKISTDGLPPILFYLMGQTFWNYFSDCLNKTSNTFIANAAIFGKVYFPRLVMPIAAIISNLFKLGLQLLLFLAFYIYYLTNSDAIEPQPIHLLILPVVVFFLGLFGLSLGIVFSSLTTKYRDLSFVLGFGVQFLMYVSCVVFPISIYPEKIKMVLMYNPILNCMEATKFALTGHGMFSWYYLLSGFVIILITFFLAVLVFNRTEKNFMDTV